MFVRRPRIWCVDSSADLVGVVIVLKVRVAGTSKGAFDKLENKIESLLKDVRDKTIQVAKANTPKRSGLARRSWTKKSNDKGFEVSNRVHYIQYLEKGTSKQAPRGIVKPTVGKMAGYVKSRRLKR